MYALLQSVYFQLRKSSPHTNENINVKRCGKPYTVKLGVAIAFFFYVELFCNPLYVKTSLLYVQQFVKYVWNFSFVEKILLVYISLPYIKFVLIKNVYLKNKYQFTGLGVSNAKLLPHIKYKTAFGPHSTNLSRKACHWNIE